MWALLLLSGFNWLSLLSPLWGAACLVLCLQAGLLIYVVKKQKRQNAYSERKPFIPLGTPVLGELRTSSQGMGFSPISAGKLTTLIVVGMTASFLLARYSIKQRGFCNPTGDYAYSDTMLVTSDFRGKNYGSIIDKLGQTEHITICPTITVDWVPGVQIKEAVYEFRNGCMDFSSGSAYFKVEKDELGNYILANNYGRR